MSFAQFDIIIYIFIFAVIICVLVVLVLVVVLLRFAQPTHIQSTWLRSSAKSS